MSAHVVQTVDELEQATGRSVAKDEHQGIEKLLEQFPVKLTEHLLPLVQKSDAVARQFLPDIRELHPCAGQTYCFVGLLDCGLTGVERMYADRCIIKPTDACPAWCRFCFRRFSTQKSGAVMSPEAVDRALAFVAADSRLQEVLITGGEPVLNLPRLSQLLSGLRVIPHVGPIRVACRSLVTQPALVDTDVIALLQKHQDLRNKKPVEVCLHCNHVDELTSLTVDRIAALREAGIHVCSQVVLLRGVNSEPRVLLELLRTLRAIGVENYHIYFAGPVLGMTHMRPTLAEALQCKAYLRRHATGRLNPHLIVTTRLGKVELGVDGWVVEREQDGVHVWIRTPYTLDYFQSIDSQFELPEDARIDDAGYIVMRYLDGSEEAPHETVG